MFNVTLDGVWQLNVDPNGNEGGWRKVYGDWAQVFEGNGGENSVTVQMVGRQDFKVVISVMYATVDDGIQYATCTVDDVHLTEEGSKKVEDAINKLIHSF